VGLLTCGTLSLEPHRSAVDTMSIPTECQGKGSCNLFPCLNSSVFVGSYVSLPLLGDIESGNHAGICPKLTRKAGRGENIFSCVNVELARHLRGDEK